MEGQENLGPDPLIKIMDYLFMIRSPPPD